MEYVHQWYTRSATAAPYTAPFLDWFHWWDVSKGRWPGTTQDIRELHIGLLNMMPDAALAATERQFFRLVGQSNAIAQFYLHPFTLKELKRGAAAEAYIAQHYETFEQIKAQGLDALIITGANVTQPDLALEPFWKPLNKVIDWAYDNVASTLCSCLATHAVLQFRYGQKRRPLGFKRWGVYPHRVVDRRHPLVTDVNTRCDVPHSRFNEVTREQFEAAGLHVLVESDIAGVHLAVSPTSESSLSPACSAAANLLAASMKWRL